MRLTGFCYMTTFHTYGETCVPPAKHQQQARGLSGWHVVSQVFLDRGLTLVWMCEVDIGKTKEI